MKTLIQIHILVRLLATGGIVYGLYRLIVGQKQIKDLLCLNNKGA